MRKLINVERLQRSRLHHGVWMSFAAKGGGPALREGKWSRRIRNWNGLAFNHRENSIWIEFRRFYPR